MSCSISLVLLGNAVVAAALPRASNAAGAMAVGVGFFDWRSVQKCVTNHIPWATAYFPPANTKQMLLLYRQGRASQIEQL